MNHTHFKGGNIVDGFDSGRAKEATTHLAVEVTTGYYEGRKTFAFHPGHCITHQAGIVLATLVDEVEAVEFSVDDLPSTNHVVEEAIHQDADSLFSPVESCLDMSNSLEAFGWIVLA
jgi:hypothetical protein